MKYKAHPHCCDILREENFHWNFNFGTYIAKGKFAKFEFRLITCTIFLGISQ